MQIFWFGERMIAKSTVDFYVLHLVVQILDCIIILLMLGSHWWALIFIGEKLSHKIKSETSQNPARLLHPDKITGIFKRLLDCLEDRT
jgi:hypothetical protein